MIKFIWNLIIAISVYINFNDRGYIDVIKEKAIKLIKLLNDSL